MSIKFTEEQEARAEKHWDRSVMRGLLESNVPREFMEKMLVTILSIESDEEFIKASNDWNLMKNEE